MSTPAKRPSAAKSKAAAYDRLAPFYPQHWGAPFLDGALAMYAEWLAPHLPAHGARVLDVCCGTGEFAAWLSAAHDVTGVDLSGPMLDVARVRVPGSNFVQADMRTFRLAVPPFDAAVCFYNSFNQAMNALALRKAFASVARHLHPGGWLLFDVIDESAYSSSWDFEETAIVDGRVCDLRYRYNPQTRIATCRALVDGEWSIVRQRPIEIDEIRAALDAAGFAVETVAAVANVSPSNGRSMVLARRVNRPAESRPDAATKRVERAPEQRKK